MRTYYLNDGCCLSKGCSQTYTHTQKKWEKAHQLQFCCGRLGTDLEEQWDGSKEGEKEG